MFTKYSYTNILITNATKKTSRSGNAVGEYIPHEEWVVHFSRTLFWTREQMVEKLLDALIAGIILAVSMKTAHCSFFQLQTPG